TLRVNDATNQTATHDFTVVIFPCSGVEDGRVAWWPGDGNANDTIGGNNGAFQNGATASAAGQIHEAFSFDGGSQYVEVPSSASLSFSPTSSMTVVLWAYRTGSGRVMHLVGKRAGCGGSNNEI